MRPENIIPCLPNGSIVKTSIITNQSEAKVNGQTWASRTAILDKVWERRSFIDRSLSLASAALASASYKSNGQKCFEKKQTYGSKNHWQ